MKPKFGSLIAAFAPLSNSYLIVCASLCAVASANADQTWTGAGADALWTTTGNWSGAAAPGVGELAIFDATSIARLATTLGADTSILGIKVVDPAGALSVGSLNSYPATSASVTVDVATDTFTYAPATPLAAGDRVTFTATTLPGNVTATGVYYVINPTATTFQVSTTVGGTKVDMTGTPSAVVVHGVITAANATDVFTLASSFFPAVIDGDLVVFSAQTAPTGLTLGRPYHVVNATATTFQVAETRGGAVVNFTTDGVNLRMTVNNAKHLVIAASGVDMSAAAQNLTISSPLDLTAAQTWNIATSRTLTVSGNISGSALTKAGVGAVTLSGTNTFSGPTLVTGGTLTFSTTSDATPGTGFDISNSALVSIGYGTGNTDDNIGTLAYSGTGGTLTSTVSNSRTITTGSVTVPSGAYGIFNAGGGRCTINNSGTATGAGTFRVNIGTPVVAAPDTRHFLNGNWSGFTGTLELNGTVNGSTFGLRANNGNFNSDLSKASVVLSSGTGTFNATYIGGNNGTVRIGALSGSASTNLLLGTGSGASTFLIGEKNLDTTFDGTIANGASTAHVDKAGSGVLTLTGTNTHTGTTTVTAGTLKYNGSKTGTGATNVNTGGTLAGIGTLAGTTSVNLGGTLAPGDAGTGNLTFANLTLNNGGTLKLGTTPTTNKAVVQTAGTLTLASGIIVDVNSFGTDGTYDIIDITGATLSGTAATAFTATNTSGGKVYTFSSTATAVRMTIAGSDPSNYWNVDGGGSWATALNWTKNPAIPNAPEAIAKIGPGAGGLGVPFTGMDIAITLDGDRTVGLLAFDDNSGTVVTIDPGTPSGSLLMDNGASPSNMVVVAGNHIVNAPVVMNSLGMGVDAGNPHSLTLNGVVSGIGASLIKTGTGKLFLTGDNTYDGGTILSGGVLNINSATSLGNATGALRFTGGTLQIENDLFGITRSYQVSGTSNALIDTNGFSFGYDGVISPYSGGTGGLVKSGAGTLTLAGANTYTGNTTVNAGVVEVVTNGIIDGAALTFGTAGGTLFHVNGGTFEGTTTTVPAAITGFRLSSGSAAFTGALNAQDDATGSLALINVQGGSLSAASVSVGRASSAITTEPAAGATNSGFVVNGASIVNIAGNLSVSGSNSTANSRMDDGSVTVGGTATIGLNNTGRWSVLDVNGGSFTLNNTATGVQLGNGQTGNAIFIVQDGGVANVGKFTFNAAGTAGYAEIVKVNGGTLYVGAGGMVRTGANASCVSTLKLQGGTLGASADWISPIDTTLTGTPIIKTADATAAPFNITLSGVLSGTGALTKTGGGTLTLSAANTYAGNTTVAEGTLALPDNSRLLFVLGATSGNTNQLAGAGTITLDGDFAIDTAAAVALTSGTWVLENATSLPGAYGGSFQVVDPDGTPWTDAGSEKWTKTDGAKTWSFDETTGTLTLSQSGFSSWATTHAGGGAANADFDGDGVSNAAEWVLGGLETTNDLGKLPGVSTTGGNLIFTFVRDQQSISADTTVSIETSTDLAGWPNSYGVPDIATPVGTVTVAKDTAPGKDTVTLTVPQAPDAKKFAHLKVVITP